MISRRIDLDPETLELLEIASVSKLREARDAVLNRIVQENGIEDPIVYDVMRLLVSGVDVPAHKTSAVRQLAEHYDETYHALRMAFEERGEGTFEVWRAAFYRYNAVEAVGEAAEEPDSADGVGEVIYEAGGAATTPDSKRACLEMAKRILRG